MALLRVRTVFTGVTGSPWLSTLYFLPEAVDATQADADAAVVKAGDFWDALRPQISSLVSFLSEPQVADLALSGEQVGAFSTTPVGATGQAAGDPLPYATQGLMRLFTPSFINGRQVRGRAFIPGGVEAASTAGVPIGAYTTAANAAGTALLGGVGPQLAVWSRTYAAASAVASVSTWSQWAVLRSRRD